MEMTLNQYLTLMKTHDMVPVYKVYDEDLLTPIGVYSKLRSLEPSYILESVGDPKDLGRYSFIGLETETLTEVKGNERFEEIETIVASYKGPFIKELPSATASIIGYMAYNGIEDIHPIKLKSKPTIPKYQLLLSKVVVALDHLNHQLIIMVNVHQPKEEDYEMAMDKINCIYQKLTLSEGLKKEAESTNPPLVFKSNFEKNDYMQAVQKVKDYIIAGDVFQVVLSQKFTAKGHVDGFELYRNLRKENPSPYLSYIRLADVEILCSSPEMLVRLDEESVETAPIAGTRAVKNDGKDDLREKELLSDHKDKAEHLMLVDLGRNDIGKISAPGSVTVPVYCEAKRFSKVMHLVSSVRGKPANGMTGMDALRATFPAGTVSGAPKLRAMEIINELEPDSRDVYAGSILMMNQSGHLNSCISIRTIQLKKDEIMIQAGGGIVFDSNPNHEFLEVLNKSRAMFNAVEKTHKGEVIYDFDYR